VRVAAASVEPYRLALRAPLVTARGALRERAGLLLRIRFDDGLEGVGEAAPLAGFGGEPLAESRAALEKLAGELPGHALDLGALDVWAARLGAAPAARAALDGALHDATARRRGVPVAALLCEAGEEPAPSVAVNALLDAPSPAALDALARARRAEGFASFKLKVGGLSRADDLARATAVRDAIGDEATLRLDANRAWDEDEAARALAALAPLGLEWVEEPLADARPETFARLRQRTATALAVDESLGDESDVPRWLDAAVADACVIKPAWLGGLASARRVAERAREAGLACVVTTALDAAVGRATALHLAAALRGPHACGLATGERLAGDVASLPPPVDGRMALPPDAGLGVAP
jgi:o-succinylbenzoate synthase